MKKIYALCGTDFIKGKVFPMGSVVLILENGVHIVCSRFDKPRKEKLFIWVFDPRTNKWGRALMQNEYSCIMWDFHKQKTGSSWVYNGNYEQMMEHDRRHKHGTGGVRLSKYSNRFTDYECKKDPLHDFPRVWN